MKKFNFNESYLVEGFFDDITDELESQEETFNKNIKELYSNQIEITNIAHAVTLLFDTNYITYDTPPNEKYIINLPDNLTTLSSSFSNIWWAEDLVIRYIDMSNITDMSYMFCCQNRHLKLIKFINVNTSKVTNMTKMFANLSVLKTLDIRNFDISSVLGAMNMFVGCDSLDTIICKPQFKKWAEENSTYIHLNNIDKINWILNNE